MKETEIKLALKEGDYTRLSVFLQPFKQESLTYWNLYYDSPNRCLKSRDISFRIRIIEGSTAWSSILATLKTGRKWNGNVSTCKEHEIDITSRIQQDSFLINYAQVYSTKQIGELWKDISQATGGHAICLIGGIKVDRTRYMYQGERFELDRVHFSSEAEDYELEVETENPTAANKVVSNLFKMIDIEKVSSKKTKRGRFRKFSKKHGFQGILNW